MARFASEAERMRAHRAAFLLAQQLGCTPREAEAELKKRDALARIEDSKRRLAAMSASRTDFQAAPATEQPWMMRDLDK